MHFYTPEFRIQNVVYKLKYFKLLIAQAFITYEYI